MKAALMHIHASTVAHSGFGLWRDDRRAQPTVYCTATAMDRLVMA